MLRFGHKILLLFREELWSFILVIRAYGLVCIHACMEYATFDARLYIFRCTVAKLFFITFFPKSMTFVGGDSGWN